MRAAVLREMGLPKPYSQSKPLSIEEVELHPPQAGEVLVKIHAAGLCHSDLSVLEGNRPRPMPMVLGHEAAGEVIEVGAGVQDIRPGQKVVCAFVPSCGHCAPCREGRPALCEPGAIANGAGELLTGGRRLYAGKNVLHHHLGVSAFAEYAVLSQHSIVPVETELPFSQLALFGCAVMTGVGAVIHTARLPVGASVAVVGLGGVGLSALMGARLAGARQMIAIDTQPAKLALASELGATHTYDARLDNLVELVREETGGGLEFVFETAGVVTALVNAYQITRRGGTTVTTGLPHPHHMFSIPQVSIAAEERTIKGSYVGSCIPSRDIPRFIQLCEQGLLPVQKLLSKTMPLEDINQGFDELAGGEASRLVVVM